MTVARRVAPNYTTQSAAQYKANIDAAFAVDARFGGWFAPHQVYAGSPNPDLAIEIDAGALWDGSQLNEIASQVVGGFTIPSAGQSRVDRVVIDGATGAASRVAGTPATGSPTAVAPQIPSGKIPVCQVLITSADTVITDSMITDERVFVSNPVDNLPFQFRLTLTPGGYPVTFDDVTGSTLYCAPCGGRKIALYSSSAGRYVVRESDEFSLALGNLTAGKPYDIFAYDNAGTPTLEALVWTDDSTRATALARVNGVMVKSTDVSRRYVGSIYMRSASPTETEDSAARRLVYNYYNRVRKPLRRVTDGGQWNYSTKTFRQAAANSANQVEVMMGMAEDALYIVAAGTAINSIGTPRAVYAGIGVGSTSVNGAHLTFGSGCSASDYGSPWAVYDGVPAVGYQYYAWLEAGDGSDTQTWLGNTASPFIQTGMYGHVWC